MVFLLAQRTIRKGIVTLWRTRGPPLSAGHSGEWRSQVNPFYALRRRRPQARDSGDPSSFFSGGKVTESIDSHREEDGERLLDPRTFPVNRMAALIHALPPPGVPINVAALPGGAEAAEWLNAHGRPARLVPAPSEPHPTVLWEPSPGLAAYVAMVSRPSNFPNPGEEHHRFKTALDLGCGTGRDAVFLAMRGWRVTAADHLPDALDRARLLAKLHDVELDLRLIDVARESLPTQTFDLVTAFRYLPDLAKMASVLAPGGTLLVETFTDRERERTGKPRDPRFVLPAAAPPPLPEGLVLIDYRIHEHDNRELATLKAKRLRGGARPRSTAGEFL